MELPPLRQVIAMTYLSFSNKTLFAPKNITLPSGYITSGRIVN